MYGYNNGACRSNGANNAYNGSSRVHATKKECKLLEGGCETFRVESSRIDRALISKGLYSVTRFVQRYDRKDVVALRAVRNRPFLVKLSGVFMFYKSGTFLSERLVPCLHDVNKRDM